MNLRRANPDDASDLARIHLACWKAAYQGLVPDEFLQAMSYEKRVESFREALLSGLQETYLVEEQSDLVGQLTVGACRDNDVEPGKSGEIWGIYLLPHVWRQGLGTQLVSFAENLLGERGHTLIFLWVFEENFRARRFYEAVGYQPDGARKTLERGKTLSVIRYRKDLEKAVVEESED